MWAICPLSASSNYHAQFYEGCYQKNANSLKCMSSSSDTSGYHAYFHEGHDTVGEWQGRGMAWHGRETVWARHGICKLAFTKLAT
jgi:hypothetical protein